MTLPHIRDSKLGPEKSWLLEKLYHAEVATNAAIVSQLAAKNRGFHKTDH